MAQAAFNFWSFAPSGWQRCARGSTLPGRTFLICRPAWRDKSSMVSMDQCSNTAADEANIARKETWARPKRSRMVRQTRSAKWRRFLASLRVLASCWYFSSDAAGTHRHLSIKSRTSLYRSHATPSQTPVHQVLSRSSPVGLPPIARSQ